MVNPTAKHGLRQTLVSRVQQYVSVLGACIKQAEVKNISEARQESGSFEFQVPIECVHTHIPAWLRIAQNCSLFSHPSPGAIKGNRVRIVPFKINLPRAIQIESINPRTSACRTINTALQTQNPGIYLFTTWVAGNTYNKKPGQLNNIATQESH